MKDLAGRVAVVTGAGSGIGRAVAGLLSAQGMKVALADVEATALDDAVQQLRSAGRDVIGVRTDVADRAQLERLAETVMQQWGAVHVVHNNAGVVRGGLVGEIPQETWDWVLGVDLWSVIWGCQIFLPLIRASGGGHIVNTASVAGLQGPATIAPYSVAKFGVVGLTESLRAELDAAKEPIGASVLCPGAVNTKIVFSDRNQPSTVARNELSNTEKQFQDRAGKMLATLGKDPAEVAEMVLHAIVNNKFWIITHPDWIDVMERRVQAMRTGDLVQGSGG